MDSLHACLRGAFYSEYLSFALRLGLFDALGSESTGLSLAEISASLSADPEVLASLCEILLGLGLIERAGEKFALTEQSARLLVSSSPDYAGPELTRSLTQELPALREGMEKFLRTRSCEPTGDLLPAKELSRLEELYLSRITGIESGPFLSRLARASAEELSGWRDFSGHRCAVDLGGNDGSFLIPILQRNPALRGIIADLPQLRERAEARIKAAGLEHRCSFLGLNFFAEELPPADLYFCGYVLHDWKKSVGYYLLRKIHRALKPGGELVLHENFLDDPEKALVLWGNQLLFLLCRQALPIVRTSQTYRDWLAETGFTPGELKFGGIKSFLVSTRA